VYSTVDRNAPHVKFVDVWIGESPSNQSYLLGDKIIEVAKSLEWMLFIPVWF
jgi:propionyl-CoA carboxylase alpha chain